MTHAVGQQEYKAQRDGQRISSQQHAGDGVQGRNASVSLRRLLALATLTPPQAVHIAVEVLASLNTRSGSYGAFDADDVLIDAEGRVRLAERGGEFVPGTAAAAGALVQQLVRNADRPAAHRRPEYAALLAALTRCAGELATGDANAWLAELGREQAAIGSDRDRLSGELAALVAVPLVRVGATPRAEPAPEGYAAAPMPIVIAEPLDELPPAAAEPAGPSIVPSGMPPPAGQGRQVRTRLVAVVTITVLAVAALITALALTRPSHQPEASAAPKQPVSTSHAGPPAKSAAASHEPRRVPKPAPAAAGAISRVTMTPAERCSAGSPCEVTVRVWLRPPGLSSLTWHAELVNRCTGGIRTLDSGSMIAEPGWRSAYTTVQLHLPHKRSMAALAVVDSPVSAASRPLLVPADGGSCTQR